MSDSHSEGTDPRLDPGTLTVRCWRGGLAVRDTLAVEEPLEIYVNGAPLAVVMRTPGEDLDLVAGFLATEGVIDNLDDLLHLAHCEDPNAAHNRVHANLAPGVSRVAARLEHAGRAFIAQSSCGVCGKRTIEQITHKAPPISPPLQLDAALVPTLPAVLRATQPRFAQTGGLHGAALITPQGQVICAREDIGRHNAVDKIIGAQLRQGRYPLHGLALVISSRAGFEIMQKALLARIGAVVALGAASSLAVALARRGGVHLYSFVRSAGFNHHPPGPPLPGPQLADL